MTVISFNLDDNVSVIETEDAPYPGWGFSCDGVTVSFSNDAWWRLIESLQEWLGECPHCAKQIGSKPEDTTHDR